MVDEMLQVQKGVNSVILSVNNFLGDGPPQNVDRIGVAARPTQANNPTTSTSTAG